MKIKLSLAWIMAILFCSCHSLYATSVLDILNEESKQATTDNEIQTETNAPEEIPSTPTTESQAKPNPKQEQKIPSNKAEDPKEEAIKEVVEPESFVMNFASNKSCSYLNKELKKYTQDEIGVVDKSTKNFQIPLFSNLQEQDDISIFLKDSLITFKDEKNNILSQIQLSNNIKDSKIYAQNKKLFILGNLEDKIALISINFTNLKAPTIQHFYIFNGYLEDAKINEDTITLLTKKKLSSLEDLETYEAQIENWKIKILKKDFECNEVHYLAPDRASSKNLGNKMSLYSINQINIKDNSVKQKKIIGSNLNISLQKDYFLAYAFIKEDAPLLCNWNLQCTLDNGYEYTLVQRFDFQKSWPTHLLPWYILSLRENEDKISIISTNHFITLDKNLKIVEKYKTPTTISKAFFVFKTPIGISDKISYYVLKNNLLSSEIEFKDWAILENNESSFTLVNEEWLKYYIFNDSWVAIKRNLDFQHTQLNTNNMVFDKSKNFLHLPMLIWEEKPSEICNYEKVKIDWEIQEKEKCHTENVIKQAFLWVKTIKIPSFRIIDEQKSIVNLQNIFVWTKGTLFE